MRMPSASVLASAVINITANTRGLDHAMAETRRQMHGFMTMANAFGGRFGGLLSNVYGVSMHRGGGGMQAIANAMANARNMHAQQMTVWRAAKPQKSNYQQLLHGLPVGLNSRAFAHATAAWQSAKPNYQAAQAAALKGVAMPFNKMTLAIGVVVGALGGLAVAAKAAAVAASNAEEAYDRTTRTFGSYADTVFKKASENASLYGVARRETMELASSAGMMLQSAGIGEKQSATMGANLAQAAAEASSLHNVSVDEAMTRIQSALAGTPRAIRAFGVAITEARTEARALQMGLVGLDGVVSDGAKTIARYALITEGLSRAAGDIERSQDRVATQLRMLGGNLENLGASIGEVLIPGIASILQDANSLIKNMTPEPGILWDAVRILFGAPADLLGQERAKARNEQMEIDEKNKDLILAANEDDVVAKAMRRSGRGASHTDLAGLNRSLQDAVTGDKNSILRNQAELQKKALEEHKRLNEQVDKLLAIQKKKQGGGRF